MLLIDNGFTDETIMNVHRRFSEIIIDTFRNISHKLKSDRSYRSLSTGDLSSDEPSTSQSDFAFLDFSVVEPATILADNFDDCDRVPLKITRNGHLKLLSQSSAHARKLMRTGSSCDNLLHSAKIEDLHRCQPWFFVDVEPEKAHRILMCSAQSNCGDEFFMISYFKRRYVLSVWSNMSTRHIIIRHFAKKNGAIRFQIDFNKTFRNLCDLVEYYQKNESLVLGTKLGSGVRLPVKKSKYSANRTRA